MYSLTFRVRVTTPPQYGPNGTAHAAGASILSPARGVFAGMRSVRVRHACGGPGGLPLGSATHFHSNATRAPIANPPNSAQLGGIPYHSPKLHPGPCNSVGLWPRTDRHTDRHTQTDTQTRVTTIHFSWSTTHAKCNDVIIFRVSRRRNAYWSRASVCLSVCRRMPTLLHGPGCNLAER